MDEDSLYLTLSEHDLYAYIRPAMKKEWNSLQSGDCMDEFSATSTTNFFPLTCCAKHKQHDRWEPGLFREENRCREMICLCSKTYSCYYYQINKFSSSCKSLKKRTLEDCGDSPMSKSCHVLEEVINVTSTNRGFRTIHHAVATYEQEMKRLSYFYPKRNVQQDRRHTLPPNI